MSTDSSSAQPLNSPHDSPVGSGLEPGHRLLHTRAYDTVVFLRPDGDLLVRGLLRDTKPPGIYVADDPDPLDMHEMHVELVIDQQTLKISDANVVMETHPHETCPAIAEHYRSLIGLPIARGFSHKVRELFGGPRGCAHTTALLLAMAPAVIQSLWSVRFSAGPVTAEDHAQAAAGNFNTCHVWAEDGELARSARAGAPLTPPLAVSERLVSLGRDPLDWHQITE